MIDNPVHALVLNDLDLLSSAPSDGYSIETLGEDFSFGNPVPVEVVMTSLMLDGSSVVRTSDNNREVTFQVSITAETGNGLAVGEAALVAQMGRRGTLTWTPPDGLGAATMFVVVTGSLDFLFSDLDELRLRRTFRVRLVCLPFGRSVDMVTAGSDSVADTVTVSDDCQSTTGWSAMAGKSGDGYTPTFAVDSTAGNFVTGTGAIKVTPAPGVPLATAGLSKQASTAFAKVLSVAGTAGSYLTFAMRTSWPYLEFKEVYVTNGAGRQLMTPINAGAVGNGFSRYAIPITHTSTITKLEVDILQGIQAGDVAMPPLWIDSIGMAGSSSAAQKFRSFDVIGSARTEGTFAVASPAGVAGLGDVLLYTTPDLGDGFRPDLKRWLVSGSTTADSTAVTGTYVTLEPVAANAKTFEAPATSFRPGAYAVLARVKNTSSTTIAPVVKAQLLQGSTLIGSVEATSSNLLTLAGTTDWEVVRLGVLYLPPTVPDALNAAAKIRFSVNDDQSATRLDELLVFPMEDSALTWVRCGAGTPSAAVSSRLWLDGPSPDYPRGQLAVGTSSTRTDARTARPMSRGSHLLYPGTMFAYLMASGSATATMDVSYFPAWHTHAAQVA